MGLGQQRSEAVGPGSNPSRVRYFLDFTEQNRDTPLPLLPIKSFRYQKFSGIREGSLTKFFVSVV